MSVSTGVYFDDKGSAFTPETYKAYWDVKRNFYFEPEDRERLAARLAREYRLEFDSVFEKADAVCDFQISLFGTVLRYEGKIDWNRDPVSQSSWPKRHWSRLRFVDAGSDPKFLWEINRHQFLLAPAMAFYLSGDEKYAQYAVEQILDWIECCPAGQGINWAESLEVATRLVTWVWILELLRGSSSLQAEQLWVILGSMHKHAQHVSRYFSHYISPNTHLTGEALGLFVFSMVYGEHKAAAQWTSAACAILDEEIIAQVGSDGVHKELSTCYHTYTVEYYLQYILLRQIHGEDVPNHLLHILEKMCEFCLAVERPGSSIPLIGDGDGGYALPLNPDRQLSWKWILCAGATLCNRRDFKYRSTKLPWEAAWLLPLALQEHFLAMPAEPPADTVYSFDDSNYLVYRSDWTETGDYLLFDAGQMGFLSAGHSHADFLAFEYVAAGIPILIDIGTYSYSHPLWRNFERSSQAHNTLQIGAEGQAQPLGNFSWKTFPDKGKAWRRDLQSCQVIGAAYTTITEDSHTRNVVILPDRSLLCLDAVHCKASQDIECNLYFAPGLEVQHVDQLNYTVSGSNNSVCTSIAFIGYENADIVLSKGETDSNKGVIFPGYAEKTDIYNCSTREKCCGRIIRAFLLNPNGYYCKIEKDTLPSLYECECLYSITSETGMKCFLYVEPKNVQISTDYAYTVNARWLLQIEFDGMLKDFIAAGLSDESLTREARADIEMNGSVSILP
ncbi:alginate lyase family protein [Desulfogranum japonicum]|uniref:alginate lyase family protein n=1 Tax=Desulfogranum japonicum TaxID=231447 RepID=UPI0013773E47|nr:alginate lyase family protein [Desulfogranum japonicum]